MRELLDAKEAADYLRLHEETVRRLAREGEIPAFKVGGSWRFKRSTLDAWAEKHSLEAGGGRILVVDDEKAIRDTVGDMLGRAGFEVIGAADGEEALEVLRREKIDLVFLDLVLPGMSGPSVLEAIRKEWGALPVVIITGYPESDLMVQAMQYSPITLLSKPFAANQLLQCARAAKARP